MLPMIRLEIFAQNREKSGCGVQIDQCIERLMRRMRQNSKLLLWCIVLAGFGFSSVRAENTNIPIHRTIE